MLRKKILIAIGAVISASFMTAGCGGGGKEGGNSDTSYIDEYHADYDIAMTLRSITDAIKVGERLDSLEYNYSGILTDGLGHPLYTDIQGNPGEWEIDVLSPTSVMIKNMYLGDLLPDDLKSYLTGTLNLTSDNVVYIDEPDGDSDDETIIYDFNGGYLQVDTRVAVSPTGMEGPLMKIIASKERPVI